jgi:hypothetical protein
MRAVIILECDGHPRIVLRMQASPAISPKIGAEVRLGRAATLALTKINLKG